ncbi:hypothetical protein L2E82_40556 [Cichorium intybus]|uniref:Uncharacterized protein n=1 Tax=Cichorium intybus TaxID=13427 RepID=A0ACB9AN17_CICIN|nr:hypothetical protein L2E82_40556 [Cichorium intybus]
MYSFSKKEGDNFGSWYRHKSILCCGGIHSPCRVLTFGGGDKGVGVGQLHGHNSSKYLIQGVVMMKRNPP